MTAQLGSADDLKKIREQFETIAASQDSDINLDKAALLIAAETDSSVDIDASLATLDLLAERFEASTKQATRFGVSVSSINDFIHEQQGFSGNVRDYYDPSNSYLNRVLKNKVGIPITLAIIHLAVGQRLNVPVAGINFPGHFLVRYGDIKGQVVDPFTGRLLSETDCATLLKQIAGPRALLDPRYLEKASNKDIMVRMLDNLKQIFWRSKQWHESRRCIERQLLLKPEAQEYTIQLGALHEMQGEHDVALAIYTNVIAQSENDSIKDIASKRLLALGNANKTVH